MRPCAIIPVKRLAYSKARLAPSLGPSERRGLTLKMLRHVLDVVTGAVGDVVVTGSDREVEEVSKRFGASFKLDESNSLNEAITQAIRRCVARRFETVLVVAADLPLLSTVELKRMMDEAGGASIMICPSKDCGTNALYLHPPKAIPVSFGPRSLTSHLRAAMKSGREFRLYWSPGLAFDLDTAADLKLLDKKGPLRS
ncbi:2-phospho-L-lactate guanylyltransferase [Candidatus Bathyarchaeota archaeon]|nr:2-phospho-L-lactate guanylyltransferase [Candidatus Bathyarchaeota archaeon]